MELRYYSHASIQVVGRSGIRLLTDPWLYSPIYGNMMWQFPTCRIPLNEYVQQDILYISHTHPDHMCPRTLQHFDRSTPVVIRKYQVGVNLKKDLEELGFRSIVEVEHRQTVEPLSGLALTLLADQRSFDSALVVSDGQHTFFNQNDCFLEDNDLRWIGEKFRIDMAALFFMGCGQFPGSFEMPWEEKQAVVSKKMEWSFARTVRTAQLLKARHMLPYASDLTWLRRPDLARLNGALPAEFRRYVWEQKSPVEVYLLTSGDSYRFKESPDEYRSHFKNRDEMLRAYEGVRRLPVNIQVMQELEAWEQTFVFSPDKFLALFRKYCNEAQGKDLVRDTGKEIWVGLRVQGEPTSVEYLVRYGSKVKDIMISDVPLAMQGGLHMVLTVPGNLLSMALSGALTFEDLANCRYSIARPGPFNETEDSFWYFMEGFTWYLDSIGEQPNKDDRDRLKVLGTPVSSFPYQEAVNGSPDPSGLLCPAPHDANAHH